MPVHKTKSKNKLILYMVVIILMFLATGFMIYKNYKLTAVNNFVGVPGQDILILNDQGGSDEGVDKKDISGSGVLVFDIFSDQKFRALKKNLLKKVNFIIGKENPFEAKKY